jgi:hypothetical protein
MGVLKPPFDWLHWICKGFLLAHIRVLFPRSCSLGGEYISSYVWRGFTCFTSSMSRTQNRTSGTVPILGSIPAEFASLSDWTNWGAIHILPGPTICIQVYAHYGLFQQMQAREHEWCVYQSQRVTFLQQLETGATHGFANGGMQFQETSHELLSKTAG